MKALSKSNRKHSLLTVWSKMGVERERDSIWRVVRREGGANIPASARIVPPLLPAAGHGYMVGEEDGGKHVEQRGKDRQTNKKSISEKDRQTERQKHV